MTLLKLVGLEKYIPKIQPSGTAYIAVTFACFLPAIILGLLYLIDLDSRGTEPKGCRKLGLRIQSNLADEHDEHYSNPQEDEGDAKWRVKSLWIYPVKSCTGVELNRCTVIGTGMEYDRQFCFAQLTSKFPAGLTESTEEKAEHNWKFITQRTIPAMARIRPEVWVPDPASSTYSKKHSNIQSGGVLVIKFPSVAGETGLLKKAASLIGGEPYKTVHIPFDPTSDQVSKNGYAIEDMEIWKDNPTSLLMASTENSDSWIQDLRFYLGITNHLALFRVSKKQPREVYRCAPHRDELGYQPTVGFQDAYPLHILNLASVHDVAKKMEKGAPRLGARNFRPNIVITGGDAYTEDSWKKIKIDDYEYYVACRTVRCLLPNVNPATGVRHGSEPNRTLKSFRRIDEGDPKNACLGMQMVPAAEDSKVKVGDVIKILETGEHFYIKQ